MNGFKYHKRILLIKNLKKLDIGSIQQEEHNYLILIIKF